MKYYIIIWIVLVRMLLSDQSACVDSLSIRANSASLAPTMAMNSSFPSNDGCLASCAIERSEFSAMSPNYAGCIQSTALHQQSSLPSSETSPGGSRSSYIRLLSRQTFAGSWMLDDDLAEVFGCPLEALQEAAPLKVKKWYLINGTRRPELISIGGAGWKWSLAYNTEQ